MKKLVLVITILFSLTSFNISFADSPEETLNKFKEQLEKSSTTDCYSNLTAAMDLQLIEFMKFLDETFRSKHSNSSLINIAIARFTEYRLALNDLFAKIPPSFGYDSPTAATDLNTEDQSLQIFEKNYERTETIAYARCKELMDDYVKKARELMIEHIKNNTAQKKTIMIIEKYESINNKLQDLNFEIAQMYGYFTTFKDKLPWINTKCVGS